MKETSHFCSNLSELSRSQSMLMKWAQSVFIKWILTSDEKNDRATAPIVRSSH